MTDYYTCRECHGYIFSCGCHEGGREDLMADERAKLTKAVRTIAVEYAGTRAAWFIGKAADQIEADGQRIAELEAALREVFEEWAGSEGFIPETAPEGYLLQLTKKMALIASAALGNKHD